MEKMVKLVWCGPPGHHSKLFGDLEPGRTYDVPAETAKGAQPEFWRPVESKKATKE